MSFNLLRNSRVFFTTAVGDTGAGLGVIGGALAAGGNAAISNTNTREIQVLDGFGFSQNTTSETVTLNETGASPVRGQRSFNTQLDPVDFNMTTYIRPFQTATPTVTAEESVLWNALFASDPIGGTAPAWTDGSSGTTPATCVATNSNKHQLQRFGLIVIIDTACFLIDDCVLNTATIDFGIDAIASIQWAGQAKAIRQVEAPNLTTAAGTFTGGDAILASQTYAQKITGAAFIANKLSVVQVRKGIGGSSGNYYNLPLTGGNITISNNVSYLTPALLGQVNQPVTYFAGTRAISGSLTAYLRSGSASGSADTDNATTGRRQTAQLLGDLLTDSATDVDPAFYMKISIGGTSANDRVELEMPGVVLTIPTIATEQVISTTINFTAQGTTGGEFKLEQTNELNVKYYA